LAIFRGTLDNSFGLMVFNARVKRVIARISRSAPITRATEADRHSPA
jgi:hypothetical protein